MDRVLTIGSTWSWRRWQRLSCITTQTCQSNRKVSTPEATRLTTASSMESIHFSIKAYSAGRARAQLMRLKVSNMPKSFSTCPCINSSHSMKNYSKPISGLEIKVHLKSQTQLNSIGLTKMHLIATKLPNKYSLILTSSNQRQSKSCHVSLKRRALWTSRNLD